MYKFIGLYILAILGIFIDFSIWGSLGSILFKMLIFGGISYLMYQLWQDMEGVEAEEEPAAEFSGLQSSESVPQQVFEKGKMTDIDAMLSDARFGQLVRNYQEIITDFILPDRAFVLFLGAAGDSKLIHTKSDFPLNPVSSEKLQSFVKVIENATEILVENNLDQAANLVPFEAGDVFVPASLLVIRTALSDEAKLFWIFDAQAANHFNKEDNRTLRLINQTIQNDIELLNQNLGLSSKLEYSAVLLKLANRLNSANDYDGCQEIFTETLIDLFEASKLTIALRNPENDTGVIKKTIGVDDPYKYGYEFSLDEGLNGWVIRKNKPYLIENIDKGEYFVPRFSREEKTNYGLKCFLSVPITGLDTEAIGMVTLEHKTVNKYGNKDKMKLMALTEIYADAIKKYIEQKEMMH